MKIHFYGGSKTGVSEEWRDYAGKTVAVDHARHVAGVVVRRLDETEPGDDLKNRVIEELYVVELHEEEGARRVEARFSRVLP